MSLCRTLLSSLFGYDVQVPLMPCVSVATECVRAPSPESKAAECICAPHNLMPHREKELNWTPPVECACAPPELSEPQLRVSGAVHKLLGFDATRKDPNAIAAIKEEMANLASVGTWDEKESNLMTLLSGQEKRILQSM